MTTIIEIIKKAMLAVDPTLDLSGSSTLTDLLITPGSIMMEPFIKQLRFLIQNLGLSDPQNMEPAELDAIFGSFLKFRNQGSPATGVVELFYTTPINLDIPVGTQFTDTNGSIYETTLPHYVSSNAMAVNSWLYPYYSTGPISVTATTPGVITEIGPNQIVATNLTPAPANVTNPAGFTGGTDAETNLEFVVRIMDEVINGSLGSAGGIQNTLMTTFPTIQSIDVRGMGDDEMLRDAVASGVNMYPYKTTIDFYGRVSGLQDLPYPESIAYPGVFWDDPTTSGLQPDLPTLAELAIDEFSTDQYAGIYKLNDAAYTKLNTLVILSEHFDSDVLLPDWRTSDAKQGTGVLGSTFEVGIEQRGAGNKLRLGYRVTEADVPTRPIKVNVQFLLNMLNFLKQSTLLPPATAAGQPGIHTYTDYQRYQESLDRTT